MHASDPRALYQFPYTDNALDRPGSRFVREQGVIQMNSFQATSTISPSDRYVQIRRHLSTKCLGISLRRREKLLDTLNDALII